MLIYGLLYITQNKGQEGTGIFQNKTLQYIRMNSLEFAQVTVIKIMEDPMLARLELSNDTFIFF